jgi:hypothetical protein
MFSRSPAYFACIQTGNNNSIPIPTPAELLPGSTQRVAFPDRPGALLGIAPNQPCIP